MRNAFVDGQFKHFRVDHDETHIFRLRFVEHTEDHGVHPDRFTGAGGTRNQQVRHLRKIGNHRIASDIFTQHHGQRGRVVAEFGVIQNFTQINGLAFLVWQLKANVRLTWDHFHHAYRHGRQRTRQVTGEVRNTRRFYAWRQVQFETGDYRAR